MRILILGAAGFLGTRLAEALLHRTGSPVPSFDELVLTDLAFKPGASEPTPPKVTRMGGDVADPAFLSRLFTQPFDQVFHLAASLTLAAEKHVDRGFAINVAALHSLLDLCRAQVKRPVLVFASSISTFGGPLPAVVDDFVRQTPQTSYGSHKVIAEQLINDYSRHGFVDGRCLRLPIVLTHPGPATGSVSDRIAALIREPLAGRPAVCPLRPDTRFAVASVDNVVHSLLKLSAIDAKAFGATRAMNLPALTVTAAEIVDAVKRLNPSAPATSWRLDPVMQAAVESWPGRFTSDLALECGLRADPGIDAVIEAYRAVAV